GKRLESMGVKGFGNRALYLEGSLSGDSDKLFTDKLSIQWGNSSGMIGGFIGLNKPSLSYEIQFSDIQAQWADLSWLTKTLNSQSSFQPLLSPRTAVKGSLSLSRKPDELLASSSLVIGDSRLEVSFNRVDQQESLQLDIRSFPINWLLKGATQRLSASLEANRKKGYPFEFNANIHRIDFDHGLSLERIIWEALPTGAAYSMAISSEVPGQSFEALFDYEKVKDRYSIEGKVDVNRLNALMSTPDFEALPFSTVASFSLWGSSLSDIQGQLNLDALRFFPPNRSLVEVGSVRMSHTALGQSERQFIVVSEDFVNLQVSGNYHLFDWQQAFSQLKLPRTLQLDADIQTGDRWVELIEGSTVLPEVSGYLRYTDGKLKSDIRLSQFSYDVFDMKQLRAYSNPSGGFVLDAESLLSPYFSLASVHTTIKGNRLELEASTTGAKSDRFLVNSSWNRLSDDQLLIAIDPSRFTLKQYQWVIEKRAEFMIDFNNRSVSLDRLDLKTLDNGYLSIYGGYNGNDNYAISLELENAPIETITPEIKNLSLKGNATGLLQFKKQGKRYEPRFNLSVEDLLVNNKFVGFFNGVVLGSANADIFTLQADVLNSGRATLELSGILNQTENGLFDLDVDSRFARFDISPFSELGTTTFSNLRGLASGSISLSNTLEQPELVGTLHLDDAGLSFPYLGVDFKIASSPQIRLNGTDFYFDHFKLVDTEFETATEIDGFIYHQGLKNFQFDLNVKTLSEASLVLKTRQREDALYYGTGFVSGAGSVKGNPQNTIITVDAETKQGSSLYIPLISETVDFSDDLVQFTNSIPTLEARVLNPIETQKGVSLDFNLRVTPEALVEVIVDPLSGSRLRGRGTGLFRFQIAPAEEFSIFGEYTVASGAFDYRFGGIIDKGFDLAPGGMITWNGDPYDADINLEAVYSLSANPAPLLDSSSFPRPIQTDVLIQLGGKLLNPVIDFSLRFPTLNSVVRSEIEYRLQDRSTLERNVFFLLAQGNFVNEQMGLSQQALTGNLLQSASGLLEEVLGASEVVDLGLSYEQGYRNPNANVAIEDRIGVTVSTQLGNRLLFNGKLGVPVGRVTETVVAGDVELQLILNEEGTLSAKIFNRENTLSQFLASIPGYTQGLGLSYQVDFNDFKELVRRVLKSSNTTEE
ncbi:MAG: translocation/assembly module TamB domain-containing protein, partial [Flavobacteriaceae bacterium]